VVTEGAVPHDSLAERVMLGEYMVKPDVRFILAAKTAYGGGL
jgi:hypothetical protein